MLSSFSAGIHIGVTAFAAVLMFALETFALLCILAVIAKAAKGIAGLMDKNDD